tara:strand:- start:1145 stop:1492 length:348 start_codon:yes stop_codon:yes gene_type:complete
MEESRAGLSNSLPENLKYYDSGCNYNKSCLSCSLAVCIYDSPDIIKRFLKNQRNIKILKDRSEGMSIKEISEKYKVSTRTVHRAFSRNIFAPNTVNLFKDSKNIYKKFSYQASKS